MHHEPRESTFSLPTSDVEASLQIKRLFVRWPLTSLGIRYLLKWTVCLQTNEWREQVSHQGGHPFWSSHVLAKLGFLCGGLTCPNWRMRILTAMIKMFKISMIIVVRWVNEIITYGQISMADEKKCKWSSLIVIIALLSLRVWEASAYGAGGAAAPPVWEKIVLFGQNWCTVRAKKQ